jgi:hypothetical protein
MEERDYEALYDHIANILMADGLPRDGSTLRPMFMLAMVSGGAVREARATTLPPDLLGPERQHLFESWIVEMMGAIQKNGDTGCCVAIVAESYAIKRRMNPDGSFPEPLGSLDQHPDVIHAVSIVLFRPEGKRIGLLPIGPDRTLEYRPLYGSPAPAANLH